MLALAEAPCDNARNYLFSALHRNGDGLRKLKRQLSLSSERGYVLVLLVIDRGSAPGIALGLAFVRGTNGVGFQVIRLSADYDGRQSYLQFTLLDLHDS